MSTETILQSIASKLNEFEAIHEKMRELHFYAENQQVWKPACDGAKALVLTSITTFKTESQTAISELQDLAQQALESLA